jgi:hypothetical protein
MASMKGRNPKNKGVSARRVRHYDFICPVFEKQKTRLLLISSELNEYLEFRIQGRARREVYRQLEYIRKNSSITGAVGVGIRRFGDL